MNNEKQIQVDNVLKNIEAERLKYVQILDAELATVLRQNGFKHLLKVLLFFLVTVLSIFWLRYLLVFIIVFFLILYSGLLDEDDYTPPGWLIDRYHRLVMGNLIEIFYPHIRYESIWTSLRKETNENFLLAGSLSGKDHLFGSTKNGYEYDLCVIEEKIEEKTRFKGVFLRLKSPAFFSKPIVILHQTDTIPDYLSNFKNLVIPDLDHTFSNQYSILVENLEEKNVLTLDFLQPLINLSNKYSKIRWSFVGNQIFFAAVPKTEMFSSLDIQQNTSMPKYLENFHVDMNLYLEVAEAIGQQLDYTSESLNTKKMDIKMKKNTNNNDSIYNHLIGDDI